MPKIGAMSIAEGNRLASFVPRIAAAWPSQTPVMTLDGSLVFVDISGFTALSERLATLGPIGAETLTDTLGDCFTHLLAVAYAEGGSLLKFGGDALLLLFDGDHHPQRAASAALGMRARLRDVGRISTDAGSVRLRMSVGLHSGALHLFRVGDSHQELIVAGPSVSETVEMETTATAGEIVMSGATADRLPKRARGPARGAGWLLHGKAADGAGFPERPDVSGDAHALLPLGLREHLLAGDVGAEHRIVSVGFLRFSGIDDAIRTLGPEAAAMALDDLVRTVQRAVDARNVTFLGTDIDKNGGKIILTTGAPRTFGGDEERLVLALREILDTPQALDLRAGINRGHVFAGEIGPTYRRTYTVMGDAVNLAARLMSAAAPQQILVAADVIHLSDTAFATTALPPFTVKGKREPVRAFAVGAVVGSQDRHDRAFPLIGRAQERETLLAALARATSGTGVALEITGDTGVGKSRLLAELLAHADDVPTHVIRCDRYGSSIPFHAARQLFRSLFPDHGSTEAWLRTTLGRYAPDAVGWAPLLGNVVGIDIADDERTTDLEPRARRDLSIGTFLDLVRAAFPGPLIIAFEDVERMDDASREIVARLQERIASLPWVVARTHGDGHAEQDDRECEAATEGADEGDGVIALEPLDTAAAGSLIDTVAGDAPLLPHQRAAIISRAEGNPLFLIELTRLATQGAPGDLPDSLEAVVAVEIDALAPADRRALRVASVLGTHVDAAVFEQVLDEDDVRARTARLRRLLVPDGPQRLRFAHRMVRDTAYAGAPFSLRREIHRRAADAIQRTCGDAQPELLSLHLFHGGRFEECVTHATVAGERAETSYANIEAMELYERALMAARRARSIPRQTVAELQSRLGTAAMLAGLYDRAEASYREAMRLHRSSTPSSALALQDAEIATARARIADRRGDGARALRWVTKGLRSIEDVKGIEAAGTRAHLLLLKGFLHQQQGDPRRALRACTSAIEEARQADAPRALADALMVQDWAYAAMGDANAASDGEEAIALLERLGDQRGLAVLLNNLGGVAYYQGRWSHAAAMYRRAQEAFEASGNPLDAGSARSNSAEILLDQGHLEEADALLSETGMLYRSFGSDLGVALIARHRAKIAAQRGDTQGALEMLRSARRVLEASGHHATVTEIDAWTAWCLLRDGDVAAARELADETMRRQRARGATEHVAALARVRAFCARAEGDAEAAVAYANESLTIARARDSAFDIAQALDTLIACGVRDEGVEAERDAILRALDVAVVVRPDGDT